MKRKENCRLRRKEKQEFYASIHKVVAHPIVQQMKQYRQHGRTNCYRHCLRVAYLNYRICKKLGLHAEEAARAGMLHDLFLYDWHTHGKETGERLHGLTHVKTALENAERYFSLNEREKDIILKHMWPLTIIPPRYPESFVICLVDKYCSLCETMGL